MMHSPLLLPENACQIAIGGGELAGPPGAARAQPRRHAGAASCT
jgi:hypothetical protein